MKWSGQVPLFIELANLDEITLEWLASKYREYGRELDSFDERYPAVAKIKKEIKEALHLLVEGNQVSHLEWKFRFPLLSAYRLREHDTFSKTDVQTMEVLEEDSLVEILTKKGVQQRSGIADRAALQFWIFMKEKEKRRIKHLSRCKDCYNFLMDYKRQRCPKCAVEYNKERERYRKRDTRLDKFLDDVIEQCEDMDDYYCTTELVKRAGYFKCGRSEVEQHIQRRFRAKKAKAVSSSTNQ